LYQVLHQFSISASNLDKLQKRVLDTYLNQFKRNGASLQGPQRTTYEQVTSQLTELCVKFLSNVNEDTSHVTFTREELEGMSEDYVNSLKINSSNLFVVTMKYPDALPALKLAKKETTRKRIQFTFDNRCAEQNLPILRDIVKLRQGEKERKTFLMFLRNGRIVGICRLS
jgi:Zn-dependent oligopeptidase